MRRTPKRSARPPGPKQPLQSSGNQALAAAFRARVAQQGLSVRALAERLGRPSTTVHKTLHGQRRMDPIEFVAWCDVLGIRDPVAFIRGLG